MTEGRLSKEAVRLISFCPVCERRDVELRGRVLLEEGEAKLLYVHCGHGKHAMLTLLMTNPEMVSSVGIVTDLAVADLATFEAEEEIEEDEVLDGHQFFADPSALGNRLLPLVKTA